MNLQPRVSAMPPSICYLFLQAVSNFRVCLHRFGMSPEPKVAPGNDSRVPYITKTSQPPERK